MRVAIDRFEGGYAVCEQEDRTILRIEKQKLPVGAREGDVLLIERDTIIVDAVETARRRGQINKLMDDLWK